MPPCSGCPRARRYTTWEDSKETPGGRDLVQHDPATGKSEVLVPAAHLIPPGESRPLRGRRLLPCRRIAPGC